LLGGHGGEVARYFEADASLFDDAVQADGEEEKQNVPFSSPFLRCQ